MRAKGLRNEGRSYAQIARMMGAKSPGTIRHWTNPDIRAQDNAYQKQYHKANQQKIKEKCARYRKVNKDKIKEDARQYREAHREELREKGALYRETIREAYNARSRAWYAVHSEYYKERGKVWRAANEEYRRERDEKYRKEHKHEANERTRRRRAKMNDTGTIDETEYNALFESQDGFCAYCSKWMRMAGDHCHPDFCNVEHIFPISRGGEHRIENIVLACRECNSSKGMQTIAEWRPELLQKIGNGICGQQKEMTSRDEQLVLQMQIYSRYLSAKGSEKL